ncbi:uncharacterized protein LOC142632691 [Castanea sativa]|uniref:uncharacterized protein LOC142632691 n=1 Tax=Castanea sativa TaxID=21020 RepID=UPI003F650251
MSIEFDMLYGALNSLSIDGNVTEKTKDLFSHPSPSSVLEFSTPTLLGNGIGNSIKEEDNVEPYLYYSTSAVVGNRVGNTIIEEESMLPILEEEQLVLDFWEVPIMSPNILELFLQFYNQNFNGINDIDAYPILQNECDEKYALSPFDTEFATENFSWIDDVLNFTTS